MSSVRPLRSSSSSALQSSPSLGRPFRKPKSPPQLYDPFATSDRPSLFLVIGIVGAVALHALLIPIGLFDWGTRGEIEDPSQEDSIWIDVEIPEPSSGSRRE